MRAPFALDGNPTIFVCEKLAQRGGVQHLFGQEVLQLRVLVLELLQTLGLGDVHVPVLGLPVVEGRLRHAVLARQIGGLRAGLVLLQHLPMICSSVNRARFVCPPSKDRTLALRGGKSQ